MTKRQSIVLTLALVSTSCLTAQTAETSRSTASSELRPVYREGREASYRITSTNRRPTGTSTYDATANGVVEQDESGVYREVYTWNELSLDGRAIPLDPGAYLLSQAVSLSPGHRLALPALSKVHPGLIGPMTDFLTFYADVWLALSHDVRRAGDRVVVAHSRANSWADGSRTILGQDAIDFEIDLEATDRSTDTSTLVVRHVPPKTLAVATPAEWMRIPVAESPNNWVQVVRTQAGKFRAATGKETFDVEVRLRLTDGVIESAKMSNLVDVSERECMDEALLQCEAQTRYQIVREVELVRIEQQANDG